MMDYTAIKELGKERGVPVRDLLALAEKNDPFYVGRPGQIKAAEWFTELWEQFGYVRGVHLRRVHYQIVSQDPPVSRPDGTLYENTERDWDYLGAGSQWARYLELVDPKAFVDRRNPEAVIYARWHKPGDPEYRDPEPHCYVADRSDEWNWYTLPSLPLLDDIGHHVLPDLPGIRLGGYRDLQQAYHVEVWCEKTTMNDVLGPLCSLYNVNLVTGAGEMSITAVVDFVERIRLAERPARILYVSDYDPAGLGMPISVARKIEFFQRSDDADGLDIRLEPIVVFKVPDRNKYILVDGWHRYRAAEILELEEIETIKRVGSLEEAKEYALLANLKHGLPLTRKEKRRVITEFLKLHPERSNSWIAEDLGTTDKTVNTVREKLESSSEIPRMDKFIGKDGRQVPRTPYIAKETKEQLEESEAETLRSDYRNLRGDFEQTQGRFRELIADFQPEIDAHQERLQDIVDRGRELYEQIGEGLREIEIDLDDYPVPEPDLPEENDGVLYISGRDYLDQLDFYKYYRHGGEVGR